ncbi:glyoxalase [Loktanella sp. SALINAS62]|uniref:glyoxalase n=1 Tax=Loktanella sp. SALINAS62 TaxID=2706124 RepID=UPI001B8B0C2A|nr:glyoxalase [Loktanella sp. SALINAS62]MBS1301228.1 glyoxalase [Loktanella sp. SALINAS62]
MTGFTVTGLHHVQLAMPVGAEPQARAFYVGQLGLQEVDKPADLAGRGGCWFTGGTLALHLGVEDPFVPARKAHPALIVDDLLAAHAALGGSAITALPGLRRFYITDPFGNRIEILQPD